MSKKRKDSKHIPLNPDLAALAFSGIKEKEGKRIWKSPNCLLRALFHNSKDLKTLLRNSNE